jgi:hypothetical protein
MTDEEIIEMAKQAGRNLDRRSDDDLLTFTLTFARLIAARQREIDAGICDDRVLYTGLDCAAAIRGQG